MWCSDGTAFSAYRPSTALTHYDTRCMDAVAAGFMVVEDTVDAAVPVVQPIGSPGFSAAVTTYR